MRAAGGWPAEINPSGNSGRSGPKGRCRALADQAEAHLRQLMGGRDPAWQVLNPERWAYVSPRWRTELAELRPLRPATPSGGRPRPAADRFRHLTEAGLASFREGAGPGRICAASAAPRGPEQARPMDFSLQCCLPLPRLSLGLSLVLLPGRPLGPQPPLSEWAQWSSPAALEQCHAADSPRQLLGGWRECQRRPHPGGGAPADAVVVWAAPAPSCRPALPVEG